MNKNLDPCRIFFSHGWLGTVPNSIFFKLLELSETSLAMKLIFGLQVNTDKANSRRYDVAPTINFSISRLSLKSFEQGSSQS